MANEFVQTMSDARIDAQSLSDFVFKPADFIVSRRLAPSINTLQYYIDKANSVNNAFSKSVSDATAAADIAISAANTANQNAIGLIDDVTNQATQSVQNAISGVAIDANLVTDALTTVVPLHNGATSMTQLDKNRENISLLDFFTRDEYTAYLTNKEGFDVARPLQAFFDYIAANNVGTAYATGVFSLSSGVLLTNPATKFIVGDLTLLAIAPIDVMVTINAGQELKWTGSLTTRGTGSYSYASRTCKVGVWVSKDSTSSRCTFDRIRANHFLDTGIALAYTTTASDFGNLRSNSIGSVNHESYGIKTDYTIISRTGGDFSTNQRTVITVTTLPPELLTNQARYIYLNDEFYQITSTDTETNSITVYGYVDYLAPDTGRLAYIFGSGVYVSGGDSSALTINSIDSTWCGVTLTDAALYGATVGTVISQSCGVGIAISERPSSAHIGGACQSFYTENVNASVLVNTYANINYTIGNTYEHFYTYLKKSVITRSSTNVKRGETFTGLLVSNSLEAVGGIKHKIGTTRVSMLLDRNEVVYTGFSRYGMKIPIEVTENISKKFGRNSTLVSIVRADSSVIPYIQFSAPEGYTLSGNTLENTYSSFEGTPEFTVTVNQESKVITVVPLTKMTNITQVNLVETVKEVVWPNSPVSLAASSSVVYTIYDELAGVKGSDIAVELYPQVSGVTVGFNKDVSKAYMPVYIENHNSNAVDLTDVDFKLIIRKYTDRLVIPLDTPPVEPLV